MGWNGATLFLYGVYNNGKALSGDLVGDAQALSSIETGVEAARLLEAWIDQRFLDDRASIRVGLYDLNSEFDVIDTADLFLHAAQTTTFALAQSGEAGPSIFPVTSLAARAEFRLTDALLLRTAVLDGVPGDPDHPKRTAVKLGDGDGALLVSELEYGAGSMRAAAGYWRYTARFEDLETGRLRRGNDGIYALVEGRVYEDPDDPRRGLALYAHGGWASAGVNPFKYSLAAGAVYTGILPAGPEDDLGLSVAWVESGGPYKRADDALKREVAFELTYRARINDMIAIQPDIQYVINPGVAPDVKDAFVIGLRLDLAWGTDL
jgi:porin